MKWLQARANQSFFYHLLQIIAGIRWMMVSLSSVYYALECNLLFSIGTMAWMIWICGSVACFILTSTASTQSARLPLLMTTFVFALLEYLLVSGVVSHSVCTLLQNWRFIYQDSHNVSNYRTIHKSLVDE